MMVDQGNDRLHRPSTTADVHKLRFRFPLAMHISIANLLCVQDAIRCASSGDLRSSQACQPCRGLRVPKRKAPMLAGSADDQDSSRVGGHDTTMRSQLRHALLISGTQLQRYQSAPSLSAGNLRRTFVVSSTASRNACPAPESVASTRGAPWSCGGRSYGDT